MNQKWQNVVKENCLWGINNLINGKDEFIAEIFDEESLAESIEAALQPENLSISSTYLKQIVSTVEISLHLGYCDNIFTLVEEIVWRLVHENSAQN